MQFKLGLLSAVFALVSATQVHAQVALEEGLSGALRGCEKWVLDPGSWSSGPASFVAAVGLGDRLGLVDHVEDANLPPKAFRQGNLYWRINSTPGAGYVLVVSDRLPMCHITGGGDADLQPVAEAVLASSAFSSRWEKVDASSKGDMISTRYRSLEDAGFSLIVSRAKQGNARRDRVQVLATAVYDAR
ncbi:MAG: hypothetical protein EOP18_11275 [Rhizobiaceae bacterium]|nr:MAG: hypothetical protein EOP18_11275 [Rhizobiaceae bacterium]